MTTNYCVMDIETGPLPLAQVQQFKPEFRAPANYKDLEKIQANLIEQESKWLADGALSAVTGRVLCVGYMTGDDAHWLSNDDHEEAVLSQWWLFATATIRSGGKLVGFCCKTFDLPFLVRRSWAHKVDVPFDIFEGRYFHSAIIDVAERWSCGGREPRDRISLDHLSKFLGTGAKNGDGADFARLWTEDRPKALDYLKNDLALTKAAFERLYP